MKNLILFSVLAFLTLACDPSIGPAIGVMNVKEDMNLLDKKGNPISIVAGDHETKFYYIGSKKSVLLETAAGKFYFKKATIQPSQNSVIVNPENSGQFNFDGTALGAKLSREPICDQNGCNHETISYEERQCTRYVQHEVTECHTHNGHSSCTSHVESYPVQGWQRVKVRRLSYSYLYVAELFNEHKIILATGQAQKDFEDVDVFPMGQCW